MYVCMYAYKNKATLPMCRTSETMTEKIVVHMWLFPGRTIV